MPAAASRLRTPSPAQAMLIVRCPSRVRGLPAQAARAKKPPMARRTAPARAPESRGVVSGEKAPV